jgi:hypothetical protein
MVFCIFKNLRANRGRGWGARDSGMWIVASLVKMDAPYSNDFPHKQNRLVWGTQIVVMHTNSRSLDSARDDTSRGSWSGEWRVESEE